MAEKSYTHIMQKKKNQYLLMFGLIGLIVVADQILKIWVKTHMMLGEEIPLIGDWCLLHFVENEGFAFGTKFGGTVGKIILTLVRMVASVALIWLLLIHIRRGGRTAVTLYGTLITAGAIGNLIDCTLYGVLFTESGFQVAEMFPAQGYAPLLQGSVVDMFYFPLIDTYLPEGLPLIGGAHFEFFNAIFNIADSAITVGATWFIIDQLILNTRNKKKKPATVAEQPQKEEKTEA